MLEYYVKREAGEVVELSRWPETEDQERLPENHPDVAAFINRPSPPDPYDELLDALDEVAASLTPAKRAKLDALLARRATENGGAGNP